MLRLILFLFSMLCAAVASAQTPIALAESFAGNVNFTGTQKTIRLGTNQTNPCGVSGVNTDVTATLSGIPAGATVLRATLYWAGSGATPDYDVQMERVNVTADTRRYTTFTNNRYYFAGAADVTSQVVTRRNNTYAFRRLSVDTTASFCQVEGVTGGFALLVVYSDPNEPFRVLNIYEGFQPTHYSSVTLNLSNFRIPTPLSSTVTGRIGHITWEGDSTLGNTNEENLYFNDVELYDTLNPRYNQFNSSSNVNGDANSWGIDFDAYTVTSPTIQAGQTTATTRYQSGQDLVLLQSEIVAVPNVPVSDLAVAMTVANPVMAINTANSYRITVSNNGPSPEPGPIVVTDAISSELRIDSATGTGWTCTVTGQLVSCSRPGPVASGTVLPLITIAVTPTVTPSVISNDATVGAGQNFDNVADNNTATVVTGGSAGAYVFTDGPCVHNLSFNNASQTCRVYPFATHTAGTPLTNIYITALNGSGVPTRLHTSQNRTINFYFGLSCINPTTTANVIPTFTARTPMTACAANGTKPAGTANSAVVIAGGTPSSAVGYTLTYQDVGKVQLYMIDDTGAGGAGASAVFKPASIALTNIRQTALPNTLNQAPTVATGASFVRAGEQFSMTISALSSTNAVTPNFGREVVPETFSLAHDGAVDPATGLRFADMVNLLPNIAGSFNAISAGSASGTAFTWPEVGILQLTPGITSGNYIGAGNVTGAAVNVGRFVPDHFDTVTHAPMLACAANMGCPAAVGAAYSGQPFLVDIIARSATGTAIQNYRGKFARNVTLSAWDAPGSIAQASPPAAPAGSVLSNVVVGAASFAGAATATPTYTFPNPFSSATSASTRALNWVAPTTIYLRATETLDATVTSLRTAGSVEGGVRIVAGRLQVANAYGSELLALPVPVQAQYWTGGASGRWENSITDSASIVSPITANLNFTGCTGGLAASCSLTPASAADLQMASGRNVLRFSAPGGGRNGSVVVRVNSPAWLPPTAGKIVFGVKKAALDYIRESY